MTSILGSGRLGASASCSPRALALQFSLLLRDRLVTSDVRLLLPA